MNDEIYEHTAQQSNQYVQHKNITEQN